MPSRRRLPRLACLVLAGAIVMSPAAAADGAAADNADILRPVQGGGLGERILREVDVTAERVTTRYQVDFRRALSFPVVPGRGGETLSPETRAELRSLARALASPELARERFLIAGHADAAGAESRNIELSYERARVVRDYLVEAHGIDPRRLVAAGWGSIRLPEGSTPRSGHGRRVEIALLVRALSSQPAGRLVRRRGDAAPIAMIDPVGDPHAFEAGLRLPAIRPAPEGCIQPTHDLDDFQPGGPIIGCIPIRTRR
jgi:outer membrane protein OmpA-like peptidoglycan-associated protein